MQVLCHDFHLAVPHAESIESGKTLRLSNWWIITERVTTCSVWSWELSHCYCVPVQSWLLHTRNQTVVRYLSLWNYNTGKSRFYSIMSKVTCYSLLSIDKLLCASVNFTQCCQGYKDNCRVLTHNNGKCFCDHRCYKLQNCCYDINATCPKKLGK